MTTGDTNGDGRADLVGTWDGQGVYYKDSISGAWTLIATPADQITAGDFDGDGKADLAGIWAGQAGVWVKYSQTQTWAYLGTSARDIGAGRFRRRLGRGREHRAGAREPDRRDRRRTSGLFGHENLRCGPGRAPLPLSSGREPETQRSRQTSLADARTRRSRLSLRGREKHHPRSTRVLRFERRPAVELGHCLKPASMAGGPRHGWLCGPRARSE